VESKCSNPQNGRRGNRLAAVTKAVTDGVLTTRRAYKLKSRFQRLRERGWFFAEELAPRLKVSSTTIHEWGRAGLMFRQRSDKPWRCSGPIAGCDAQ
jgi:hypothetical protein